MNKVRRQVMDKVGAWIRQEGKVPSAAVATMDKDKVRARIPLLQEGKGAVATMDPRRRKKRGLEEKRERILRENLLEEFDPNGELPCAKDLASEEALWDLYERWSRYHKPGRDYEEKLRRFEIFKKNAKMIYETNHKGLSYKLGLLKFADMKKDEMFRALGLGLRRPDKA